jgi:hypothetical protein
VVVVTAEAVIKAAGIGRCVLFRRRCWHMKYAIFSIAHVHTKGSSGLRGLVVRARVQERLLMEYFHWMKGVLATQVPPDDVCILCKSF